MTYQEEAQKVADTAAEQVLAAVAAYAAGTITLEAAAAIMAAYIAAGTAGAVALADVALAAAVTVKTGRPAAPLGIIRDPEIARLEKASTTILTDLDNDRAEIESALMRAQRLAVAEIRQAAADAYADAVAESDDVTGWVRGLEPKACQLCRWWWREGRVWPADHPFQRHTGCDCSQLIVTPTEPIKPLHTPRRKHV